MYVPKHFEETRVPVLHELVRANPLGTLVTLTPQGLGANHVPFEVDTEPGPFGTLRAHIARANSLWREHDPHSEVLAIFHGPDAYISPAWYVTKQQTGKVVPTWNYATVHAHGLMKIIEDRQWLRSLVETLTNRYEAGRDHPWKVSDAPADYIESQLGAIIGIEIRVTRLVGKWKVSQNRPLEDQQAVAAALATERGKRGASMADLVQRYGSLDPSRRQK